MKRITTRYFPEGTPAIRFGHQIGVHPSNDLNYFDTVLGIAQASEAVGFDAVFYSDHVQFQRHPPPVHSLHRIAAKLRRTSALVPVGALLAHIAQIFARRYAGDQRRTLAVLECFTTLGAIAAATERIRLGALVAGVPYRNPTLLAKINTTLDIISHGRCIVGIGASWHEEEFRTYGWRFPPVAERMDRLEEAAHVIDLMLRQQYTSYRGRYTRATNALNYPPPVQRPRPPLLIAGSGEQRTLRIVAQLADYCNIFGPPAVVAHKLKVLQQHCVKVGRPYDQITRSNYVGILVAQNAAELERKRRMYTTWVGEPIVGTPEQVIAELQAYAAVGVNYTILNFPDAHTHEPLHLFAEEVMPAFQ